MRQELCTITITGSDDSTQEVRVKYLIEHRYLITECEVLDEISIEPSDLHEDVQKGISFNELLIDKFVEIDCEIRHRITSEKVRA